MYNNISRYFRLTIYIAALCMLYVSVQKGLAWETSGSAMATSAIESANTKATANATNKKNATITVNATNNTNTDDCKRVAITFDDGPHSVYTEKLLDGLKERNVVATFFVVGSNIAENEDLIKRMSDEGHLIGNHSYTHVELDKLTEEQCLEEINKTSELVESITGKTVDYIRPPFGSYEGKKTLEGMFVILWTVDPLDWCTCDVNQVVQNVVNEVEDGDIILLHDIFGTSVDAALKIIDILKEQGYEFVTVEDLLL